MQAYDGIASVGAVLRPLKQRITSAYLAYLTNGAKDRVFRGIQRLFNLAARVLPVVALCLPATAQTDQFLPEIDFNYKVSQRIRASFQAKLTREGGHPASAELGPSLEFYLKPLVRLKEATRFELDGSKARALVFSVGYRYLPSPNSPTVNRMEPTLTFHFPMARVLLTDKNRADLDWTRGSFSWRYRNRVQVEKRIRIGHYHPAPYGSVEFFYQSKYGKWSDTALFAGCLFPIGRRLEFDPYYEHQNNTGNRPNRRLNQVGLKLLVDLSRPRPR